MMKYRCLFFFIFLYVTVYSSAQEGFMQRYDFDSDYSFFHNVLLDGDTLIIAGASFKEGQLAAMLIKMDTMGNILQKFIYFDSLGRNLSFQQGYPLIKTRRNTYLMGGDVLGGGESVCIIEWNKKGEVINFWNFPYIGNVITSFPEAIVELQDGYLFFTSIQTANFRNLIHVTKISNDGKRLWYKAYGGFIYSTFTSLDRISENKIVIGAKQGTDIPIGTEDFVCLRNWIFAIDTTGKKLWEWHSDPCEGGHVYGLHRTSDNNWIYSTEDVKSIDNHTIGWAPLFIKRDSQFNLKWKRRTAESYSFGYSTINSISPTPDSNWLGAGQWILPEPYYQQNFDNEIYACFYKISPSGKRVWSRCDTFPVDTGRAFYSKYLDLTVLPSGSAIAVGSFITSKNDRLWPWAVKVNKNGCIDPDSCNINTSFLVPPFSSSEVLVYPNPARDKIHILFTARKPMMTFQLVNNPGCTIRQFKIPPNIRKLQMDVGNLNPGMYFYRITSEGRVIKTGKIIIQ